jgi:hypothetical protein
LSEANAAIEQASKYIQEEYVATPQITPIAFTKILDDYNNYYLQ